MKNAVNIPVHKVESENLVPLPVRSECELPSEPIQNPADSAPEPAQRCFETERAERKRRSQSLLLQLDGNETAQLIEWLSDPKLSLRDIVEMIAAPPPEGFGIRTHPNMLHRLRVGLRSADAIARIENMLNTTADVTESANLSRITRVQSVISNLLHAFALELAAERPGSQIIPRLLTSIEKLSALEHKRELLVLAREKLTAAGRSAYSPRRHHVDLSITRREPSVNHSATASDRKEGTSGAELSSAMSVFLNAPAQPNHEILTSLPAPNEKTCE